MLYTFLDVLCRYSAQDSGNYKMPIMCSNKFYQTPSAAEIDTWYELKRGRTEGYDDITYFMQELCTYLEFNPYYIKKFLINPRGLATKQKDVIEAFMGEYNTVTTNQANYYPAEAINANLMGYTYFADGYSAAQASIGQTPYGSGNIMDLLFCNIIYWDDTYAPPDLGAVTYEFEIWPEDVIKTGYIDTSKFQRDNNNHIKTVHLRVDIIYDPNEETWNYYIALKYHYYNEATTNYVDSKLDDAKTDHVYNPANPMDNKPENGDEGGNGDYDDDNEPLSVPPLPTLDLTSLGGIKVYRLMGSDFAALMAYMGSASPGDAILKWFSNPIQAITSCYVLPYPVHVKASAQDITVLGMTTGVAADLAMPYEEYNLGSKYIGTRFGDCYLDYSPSTRVQLFLPFIGMNQLSADDVIGHNIGIVYQFDNISGGCVAYVKSDGDVKYTFSGSCAMGVPISQANWGQFYISAAVSAAKLAGGALAGAQAALSGAGQSFETQGYLRGMMGGLANAGISSGLDAFNSKPNLSRSGACTGAAGALGFNKPFMVIERPDKAKIENPKNVIGITSGRTLSLGSLSGFNTIEHINLTGIAATQNELNEIEALLHKGVIF